MSTFSFNPDIPATGHTPSQDYTGMQNNYLSTQLILGADHVTFNTTSAAQGTHLQTTFNQFATPSGPTAPGSSVAYPAAGVASSTTAQMYFQNTQATFLMSCVRAFGSLTAIATPTGLGLTNGYNIVLSGSTQTRGSGITTFVINLPPNCVAGTDACVLINTSSGNIATYTLISNRLTIVLTSSVGDLPVQVNFAILQA